MLQDLSSSFCSFSLLRERGPSLPVMANPAAAAVGVDRPGAAVNQRQAAEAVAAEVGWSVVTISNVKTVKEQTFHKRSTNVSDI